MQRRLLLLGLCCPLFAQQTVRVTADCVIGFSFSGSGSTPVVAGNPNTGDNRQAGCESWTLQYQSVGFSGVSLTIQSAGGSLTAGTFGTYAGTIDTGVNPNTSTTGATTTGHNGTVTIPWIRVNAALTGTGTLNGVLYGIKSGPTVVVTATLTPTGTQDVNLVKVDGTTANNGGLAGAQGVGGLAASGAVPAGNPVTVAGTDGTDIRTVSTDATGRVNVNANITPSGTQDVNITKIAGAAVSSAAAGVQKVGVVGNTGATVDSAPAATAPTNAVQVAGTFSTTPTTLTNGQAGALELDSAQNLLVNLKTSLPAGSNVIGAIGGTGTFKAGQVAVTGTAAALPSNASNAVCVKALIANTINVYVGPTGVTTGTGFELAPGQGFCEPVNNSNLLFVIASTTGASVTWALTD